MPRKRNDDSIDHDRGVAEYLAHVAASLEDGRPVPDAEPLIAGLRSAADVLTTDNPKRRDLARSRLCSALGISAEGGARRAKLDSIEVADLFDPEVKNADIARNAGCSVREVQRIKKKLRCTIERVRKFMVEDMEHRRQVMTGIRERDPSIRITVEDINLAGSAATIEETAQRVLCIARARMALDAHWPGWRDLERPTRVLLRAIFEAHHETLTPAWVQAVRSLL
mgnify:CR=1 FL=1